MEKKAFGNFETEIFNVHEALNEQSCLSNFFLVEKWWRELNVIVLEWIFSPPPAPRIWSSLSEELCK